MIHQENNIDLMEELALRSAQTIFPCEKNLQSSVPLSEIVQANVSDIKSQSNPILIRVVGQSGSGKSTQLIPALEDILKKISYIKINVGKFAPFHPEYTKWQKLSPELMREKTNGFALRALILFYRNCIENHVNILCDMTLLEPEIEHYLMMLAKKHGYQIQLHVLCVPKKSVGLFCASKVFKNRTFCES